MRTHWQRWRWQLGHWLGVPAHVPSWREQLAAAIAAGLGMAMVATASEWLAVPESPWLLASVGATAVLVFALPHGPLSQPWPVLGGHLLSAVVGLLVARHLGSGFLPAALAVAGAVAVMHAARCIHPPGGATALFLVQSAASAVPAWSWLVTPILLNVALVLVAAWACNSLFPWRRYPAALGMAATVSTPPLGHEAPFTRQELAAALDGLDTYLDISDEQLQHLVEAITRQRKRQPVLPAMLVAGQHFSNGLAGEHWAVRCILDATEPGARRPQVISKTVAGRQRGTVQLHTQQEFLEWAAYPVYAQDGQWVRDPLPDEG